MDLGISIMIKKPEKQKPGIFSFMGTVLYLLYLLSLYFIRKLDAQEPLFVCCTVVCLIVYYLINIYTSLYISMGVGQYGEYGAEGDHRCRGIRLYIAYMYIYTSRS